MCRLIRSQQVFIITHTGMRAVCHLEDGGVCLSWLCQSHAIDLYEGEVRERAILFSLSQTAGNLSDCGCLPCPRYTRDVHTAVVEVLERGGGGGGGGGRGEREKEAGDRNWKKGEREEEKEEWIYVYRGRRGREREAGKDEWGGGQQVKT